MEMIDYIEGAVEMATGWSLTVQLSILAGIAILGNLAVAIVLARLQGRLARTRATWDDAVVDAARQPLHWLIWVLTAIFAFELYEASQQAPAVLIDVAPAIGAVLVIALIAWFLLRAVGRIEAKYWLRARPTRKRGRSIRPRSTQSASYCAWWSLLLPA
ncbi:hypothetical protein [Alkalilimnicola ehrlichii]|uniref:hypothetical protein n=1 Tax=Alkalilimnicola ehrlichii TaxID=351052 RepID=UPI001C6DFB7D|nr:hypothetical protein [Alkalilimnicola ehrlichii]